MKFTNSDSIFLHSYVACLLELAQLDEDKSGEDLGLSEENISEDAEIVIRESCRKFEENYSAYWRKNGWSDEQAGYDFFLSRNGHGAGFFDRTDKCQEYACLGLQAAAEIEGEQEYYLSDEGKIEVI